jgi:hypothetical protein
MTASTTAYRATARSRSGKEDNSCLTRSSEMSSLALLQSLKESILSQANVKAIYGEPIAAHGKTVIPVAKIMYGYGAGAGTGGVGTSSAQGEGGAAVEEYGLFPWES